MKIMKSQKNSFREYVSTLSVFSQKMEVILFFLVLSSLAVSGPLKHGKDAVQLPAPEKANHPERFSPGSDAARGSVHTNTQEVAVAATACRTRHPIESFLQITSATDPQSDKKGGVYFLSDLREVPQIFFLSSPQRWPKQITFFPDGVSYFTISPDGEKILIASDVGGDEQYDLYLLDLKNGKVRPLLVDRHSRIESVAWGPASRWFAYTSNARNKTDMDLYLYDLGQSTGLLVTELTGHHTVTDVSPDGKRMVLTAYRSVTDSDVLVWNLETKSLINLTQHEGQVSHLDGKFTADSKGILLLSDGQKGVHQLYSWPLAKDRKPRVLTEDNRVVESFELDLQRSSLVFLINHYGYSRFGAFEINPAGQKLGAIAVPRLSQSVVSSVTFAPFYGRRSLFYSQSSSVEPRGIWLWRERKEEKWTAETNGLIDPRCFARDERVGYPSFDKLEIPAFLYRPVNYERPASFILWIHGGPESQYRPEFYKTFQYFLQEGFGILAPNVRGSTGYGRNFTLRDNYKNRMHSVLDAIHGARWLVEKGEAKNGHLAITGASYGGFMVLRSIQMEPKLFAAASESVGITDFVTFLKNTKPYRRVLREVEYGPLSDEPFLKSISPMSYVDSIQTPLLIFHGANDPRVPVGESQVIVEALKGRRIPVQLKIFEEEGHAVRKLSNRIAQARITAEFFETHLKK